MSAPTKFNETRPYNNRRTITSLIGTAWVGIDTQEPYQWRVDHIYVTSTSAAIATIQLAWNDAAGTTQWIIGSKQLAANQGTDGSATIDLLAEIMGAGNDGLAFDGGSLGASEGCSVRVVAALGAGEEIYVVATGGILG